MMDRPSILPYNRILVPYDGSEMSDKALAHASYLAKVIKSEVTVLHILEIDVPPAAFLGFLRQGDDLIEGRERLRKTLEMGAKLKLEEKISEIRAPEMAKISYKLKTGRASDEIIQESKSEHYNLIVMASSRITSSIKLLGSNARRVIESTTKPVLLIHE